MFYFSHKQISIIIYAETNASVLHSKISFTILIECCFYDKLLFFTAVVIIVSKKITPKHSVKISIF